MHGLIANCQRSASGAALLTAMTLGALVGCSSSDSTNGGRELGSDTTSRPPDGSPQMDGTTPSSNIGGGPRPSTPPPPPPAAPPPPPPAQPSGDGIEPITIDDCGSSNPAGLSADAIQKLQAGGGTPPRVLYPYDETVFPRGLLAPTVMWEGAPAEAAYVHIKSTNFEWRGCVVPVLPNQIEIPQSVWDTAGAQTLGTGDPYAIEVTALVGGAAAGPARIAVTIAQATIKGSIYYNSYSSRLSGVGVGGAVLRIPPGGRAEAFVSNECNGCHTISADGSRMVSQTLATGGRAYKLSPGGAANPPAMPATTRVAYAALYPNGSHYLATYATAVTEVARANLTGIGDPPAARLFETDTATLVPTVGVPPGAMMPMFSADGTRLAFTDFAVNNAHGLAMVDYDTNTHTGTNYRILHEDPVLRPGWPFVLPDNQAVVFAKTSGGDFSGEAAGLAGISIGPASDLFIVDADTKTTTLLARAMGFDTPQDASADNNTYLPFGPVELHKNYFPTVSPVAAGGYFWVFFDGVRHYGNLGLQRQLWGAAITISETGEYATDPSHPAFYLPGQEFGTGNHRAFAALDPCREDGEDCTSGIDCCGGFCSLPEQSDTEFGVEPVGTCGSQPPECSRRDERCTSDADCCPPEPGQDPDLCIAGFCAFIPSPG